MKRKWLAMAVALLACASAARAQTHPPASAFAALPRLSAPKLSADGKHMAFLQQLDGKRVAVIVPVDTAGGEKPRIVPADDWVMSSLRWAKNDAVIVTAYRNIKEYREDRRTMLTRQAAIKLDGSPTVMLLNNQQAAYYGASPVLDLVPDDSNTVFMASGTLENQRMLFTLVRMDVKTGRGVIQRGDNGQDTRDWIMDGKGGVVARLDWTANPEMAHLLLKQADGWKDVWSHDAQFDTGGIETGLLEDGTAVVVRFRENGVPRLLKFDLRNPGAGQILYENGEHEVGLITDSWTGRVVGTYYEDGTIHPRYFLADLNLMDLELRQAFPGQFVDVVSYSRARDKIVVAVSGAVTPLTYYLVDRTTRQATVIGEEYPELASESLGTTKSITYAARDGLEIPAYLTLPPGKAPKNLPLVVMPHGGPEDHDTLGFDWWVQFLANRGYAVLQPQFRGSTGFGRKFTEAGFKQWGLKMQDDLTDGVAKLAADGIADPKRVCIVGASYGGYAALAGAALTPDVYACAMSFAGVSDLRRLVMRERDYDGLDSGRTKFNQSRIGNPNSDSQQLRDTSPAYQAARVKAPVLLVHGEYDSVVPVDQSDSMAQALKSAGKSVRYVKLPTADHYVDDVETRLRLLQESEAFLREHIGN